MLRVAEQYAVSDTGRQRRINEDSLLARAPLFVVADGMGGAQAGEVASRIAVESFDEGLIEESIAAGSFEQGPAAADRAADSATESPEESLAAKAVAANARIHALSQSDADHAGMGTTLTAVYVGELEVAIAHVGDSRAYCWRDGELLRLTDDHSLVDELIRQGRLTPEEAADHPQRSIITRALGPEEAVEVDTRSFRAHPGDVYLLCSDGLTTMVSETRLAQVLREHPRLRDAGEGLIAEANEAGGRDNITVILLRLEEAGALDDGSSGAATSGAAAGETDQHTTLTAPPPRATRVPTTRVPASSRVPTAPRVPRRPALSPQTTPGSRRRWRRVGATLVVLAVLGVVLAGAYMASQSVYFIATNSRGLVTLYRGVPYELPGGVKLYKGDFVSGVSAASLSPARRRTLLDHSLRSQGDAEGLLRSLELGELSEG